MTHFSSALTRASEIEISQTNTGWRKATIELAQAEQHAKAGQGASVSKSESLVAAKRVGANIGLKAADMMLLDTLCAFSQNQDWEAGQRPIVWPSNALLIEQTGFSLSSLKRHAKRLVAAGVISVKDSPNGKRWGRRDASGHIQEAYGFDLSPLAARAEEFTALHKELQAERAVCSRLKRQITITRRMIRARLETALNSTMKGPWSRLTAHFEALLGYLPRRKVSSGFLQKLFTRFAQLQQRIEQIFEHNMDIQQPNISVEKPITQIENLSELDPKQIKTEPHTPTTNELNLVNSNEPTTRILQHQKPAPDIPMILQSCPEFRSWAHNMGGYQQNWNDLHRIADQLGPMIGISKQIWHTAQQRLGSQMATAALIIVFDKHCTGEVSSPAGYLRGIIEKAGVGELNLERSFYGRLSLQAA